MTWASASASAAAKMVDFMLASLSFGILLNPSAGHGVPPRPDRVGDLARLTVEENGIGPKSARRRPIPEGHFPAVSGGSPAASLNLG